MVELNFFFKSLNYIKLKLSNFPNEKFLEFLKLKILRWDTKYRMIKCRTTGGVSKF